MNIVITINLNGNAYQLEKSGYDALRDYLDNAARRLAGNPDRDEIIADIEQAIADKFRAVLGPSKTVVVAREVAAIIAEMGPVQDASAPEEDAPSGATQGPKPESPAGAAAGTAAADGGPAAAPKRLYRIHEGAMLAGVCNGLGAYFNLDVTIVRLLFVVLTVSTWGVGLLIYAAMVFLVPTATTPSERAAACGGAPSTAEEFIRRAKEGYYEGMRTFHDKRAHRAWKRRFKQEMRSWKWNFKREMYANAFQWGHNWQEYWARRQVPMPGAWLAVPLLTLLSIALTFLGLYAVASLVATGAFFGLVWPAGVSLWVGVVFLLVAVNVVIWPLKAMRHSFVYPHVYGPGYPGPLAGLLHSLVWAVLLVLLVWFADRHIPAVHTAVEELRPQVHRALDAFRQWWAGR